MPLDESDNFQQRHETEMAKDTIRPDVKLKLRDEVDTTLLELLKNLKEQALKQMEGKGGKKAKKGKKGKKGAHFKFHSQSDGDRCPKLCE